MLQISHLSHNFFFARFRSNPNKRNSPAWTGSFRDCHCSGWCWWWRRLAKKKETIPIHTFELQNLRVVKKIADLTRSIYSYAKNWVVCDMVGIGHKREVGHLSPSSNDSTHTQMASGYKLWLSQPWFGPILRNGSISTGSQYTMKVRTRNDRVRWMDNSVEKWSPVDPGLDWLTWVVWGGGMSIVQ